MSGYSLEAGAAGLAGVRGQLELARALREVHTQEVRQELAQFEAVSPTATMTSWLVSYEWLSLHATPTALAYSDCTHIETCRRTTMLLSLCVRNKS